MKRPLSLEPARMVADVLASDRGRMQAPEASPVPAVAKARPRWQATFPAQPPLRLAMTYEGVSFEVPIHAGGAVASAPADHHSLEEVRLLLTSRLGAADSIVVSRLLEG